MGFTAGLQQKPPGGSVLWCYINGLRQKIEEDPAKPAYIQTVLGLGYRFVV